ncbi:MAG: hypothetical protein JWP47_991 [Polaromonas sp.]|nr:hypothetical protein [Polaromonas sp.]
MLFRSRQELLRSLTLWAEKETRIRVLTSKNLMLY